MGKLSKGAQTYLDTALATRGRPPPEALARVKQSVLQITSGAGAHANEARSHEPGAAEPGEALPGRGDLSAAGTGAPGAATQAGSLAAKMAGGWGTKLAIGMLARGPRTPTKR
ncbi:MAG: hypothetical protein MUF34_38180 [Polyangiaceae bacterium]|nr:hypothetical protein [Polyangiaceae bacterium]